ncbi:MAG: M48 family metalloprotease [Alphaproteobacteria bacterium]|nr:M48 family metalloprotease [Alphaproteobacteria bacterium]
MNIRQNYIGLWGILAICFMMGIAPVHAQTVIRDTEIESYLQEWFAPIYQAAGMSADQVDIILVQDSKINAFVAGGANIFFYTGLIEKTDDPLEMVGVMAHELGHIAGGHTIRARAAMENASYETLLGVLVGAAAAVATGNPGAAGAIGTGGSTMAQRGFLKTARTFESSADQFAITKLEKAGLSPQGLATFLGKLSSQELLPTSQQSEYVRTHPLTRDRIQGVEEAVSRSPHKHKSAPAAWQEQHQRLKAKLIAFITPQQIAWIYEDRDDSIAANTARAVAAYRLNQIPAALKAIDGLIAREPDNPYFYELKGQMLKDFGRLTEALPAYEKAVRLKPDAALIRTDLAHVLIETAGSNTAQFQQALTHLDVALKSEPRSTRIHRLMATALGRMGNDPAARLHLAEEAYLQRKIPYARDQLDIALKGLSPQSREWIRAQDLKQALDNHKNSEGS